MRVTADDVTKEYVLKAQNELGEYQYRVTISTSTEPEGMNIFHDS
jgi:hypothetical protein